MGRGTCTIWDTTVSILVPVEHKHSRYIYRVPITYNYACIQMQVMQYCTSLYSIVRIHTQTQGFQATPESCQPGLLKQQTNDGINPHYVYSVLYYIRHRPTESPYGVSPYYRLPYSTSPFFEDIFVDCRSSGLISQPIQRGPRIPFPHRFFLFSPKLNKPKSFSLRSLFVRLRSVTLLYINPLISQLSSTLFTFYFKKPQNPQINQNAFHCCFRCPLRRHCCRPPQR